MKISEPHTAVDGSSSLFEYEDFDSFESLPRELCTQTYGVCFHDGRLIIGFGGKKKNWGLVGGTIEKGETFEETLRREIREEVNMEILKFIPIGCQKVTEESGKMYYQLRYVCTVRPYGPFVSDPDGGISEIKEIEPTDYKHYFDWGKIGDRIMERAFEVLPRLR